MYVCSVHMYIVSVVCSVCSFHLTDSCLTHLHFTELDDSSVPHVLRLIYPRLEGQLMLAKNVQLIEALQEIRIHEEDTSFLSPQCQYILGKKKLSSPSPPSLLIPTLPSSLYYLPFFSLLLLSPSLLHLPSLCPHSHPSLSFFLSPPFSLSLHLFSVSPPLPPENAELMLEEIKQQPCMIERLYGELV